MKTIFRAVAGVVIAASATLASAQSITLNFNDLSGSGYFEGPNVSYQGFNFSSANGTAGTAWFWAPGSSVPPVSPNVYIPGAGPANNTNISGFTTPAPTDPNQYDAFVISSPVPFSFQSAFFSGCCGSVYVSLGDGAGNDLPLTAFDPATLVGAESLNLNGSTGVTFYNTGANQYATGTELVIWAPSQKFAVDDIVLTPVPEPSAYAMMIAGLGALGFVARRRKSSAQQA